MKYIFDLDNTVVFTDAANNAAYNEALRLHGLPAIETDLRITRHVVFERYPELTAAERNSIIKDKQSCYSPEMTVLNKSIIYIADKYGRENCVLWSRAERKRVDQILTYHDIRNYFSEVFITPKISLSEEISFFCTRFSCCAEDLMIYDDEPAILIQISKMDCQVFLCNKNCISKFEY